MAKDKVNMKAAKSSKFDEFYTQFDDIQREIEAYLEFNPDVFKNKTILLPCDDPEQSNFTKYFALNFEKLGLKKLISTSYAPATHAKGFISQPTLFEIESPIFDSKKTKLSGKKYVLQRDKNGDQKVNVEDLEWTYLEGDGDFQSPELSRLRDEADMIITNPPFSLFRPFLAWIVSAKKDFLILGNMNAISYKDVFPLIKNNEMWLGVTRTGVGSMWFLLSDGAPIKTGQKMENGFRFQTVGSSAWFTNLDHGRRHQPLNLMTEAENIKFSKHKQVQGKGYAKYDNYDAIEVPFTVAIPSDFQGVMGVPVSFLGKHNPEQFEIVGMVASAGYDPKIVGIPFRGVKDARPLVDGKNIYARVLIKHKKRKSK